MGFQNSPLAMNDLMETVYFRLLAKIKTDAPMFVLRISYHQAAALHCHQ